MNCVNSDLPNTLKLKLDFSHYFDLCPTPSHSPETKGKQTDLQHNLEILSPSSHMLSSGKTIKPREAPVLQYVVLKAAFFISVLKNILTVALSASIFWTLTIVTVKLRTLMVLSSELNNSPCRCTVHLTAFKVFSV